jgi:hypothetical protein
MIICFFGGKECFWHTSMYLSWRCERKGSVGVHLLLFNQPVGKGQLREWAQSRRGSLAQHCEQFQVNMFNISKKSKGLLILILVLASSILRWNEVHCLGACWCFQPARWGPLDSRFYQSRFLLLLLLLLSPPAASDLASSGSQSAPPDLNRELQMSVSTAGSQQRAPDLSGRWGPAVFMSERTSE